MKRHRWKRLTPLLFLLVIIVSAVTGLISMIRYADDAIRSEGRMHVRGLTQVVSSVLDTTITSRRSYLAVQGRLLDIKAADGKADLLEKAAELASAIPEEDAIAILVDDIGHYYSSDGRSGRWTDNTMLLNAAPTDQVTITTLNGYGLERQFLVFMNRLTEPLPFSEGEIRFIAVAVGADLFEDDLGVPIYGNSLSTFVISESGEVLYRNAAESSPIEGYYLLDELSQGNVLFGSTVDELRDNVKLEVATQSEIRLGKTTYLLCTYPLSCNDWSIVTIVPTNMITVDLSEHMPAVYFYGILFASLLVIIGIGTAILAQKQYNTQRRNEEIESMNEHLRQEAAQANTRNKAKSVFLSGMSRDFRKPIGSIVRMAAEGEACSDDETGERFAAIRSTASDLLDVVSETLDFDRIESGSITVRREAMSIRSLCRTCTAAVESSVQEKGIQLSMNIEGIVHDKVIADAAHMRRILCSILDNAVRFTEQGGHIHFSVEENYGNGDVEYRFIIQDDGIGMSTSFLKRIWEPFAQESSQHGGTGLGMTIAKRLTELLGGRIGVTSRVGKGSVFIVTIPMQIDVETASEPTGIRILCAYEKTPATESGVTALQSYGIEVHTANDGGNAVLQFSESETYAFDLVILEADLPVMNGREAAASIRTLPREDAQDVPIYLLTAGDASDDILIGSGADGRLTRPVSISDIREVFARHGITKEGIE